MGFSASDSRAAGGFSPVRGASFCDARNTRSGTIARPPITTATTNVATETESGVGLAKNAIVRETKSESTPQGATGGADRPSMGSGATVGGLLEPAASQTGESQASQP